MRVAALILISLALGGCRAVILPLPDGRTVWAASLVTDPKLVVVHESPDGSKLSVEYSSATDNAGLSALVEGFVRGVLGLFGA